MSDMLVKLYALPERAQDTDKDYEIIRPMAPGQVPGGGMGEGAQRHLRRWGM